jgi:DNA-binding response OmpR family regulator
MPDSDGLDTIRRLRRAHEGLPIIAVTGSSLWAMATKLGANRSFHKPVDGERLCDAIDELLAER